MPRFLQSARHVRGVTLIELMVVIVIIGILANVALPAYTSYSQRGKITEATSTLSALRSQLEQYYQDNRTYGTASNNFCGDSTTSIPNPNSPNGNVVSDPAGIAPSGTSYFSYTCSNTVDTKDANNTTDQAYLLTATGRTSAGMSGYSFTIDYHGNKQTTGFPGATCKNGTSPSSTPCSCWLTKSGDC